MTNTILVNRFLSHVAREGKSALTLSAYATDLKQWSFALGKHSFKTMTAVDLRRLAASLEAQTPSTKARKLTTLRSFLRWAFRAGYANTDLALLVEVPRRTTARPSKPLSQAQLYRLRRASTASDRVLLELILQTGMRLSDAVTVRAKHLSDHAVAVPSSGEKLPLTAPLRDAIAKYGLIRPIGERSALLTNAYGRPLSVRTATTMLKNLGGRAGVRNATARNLRTTFIVRQLAEGISPIIIQRIIGHSSLATTQQYASLDKRVARSGPLALVSL